MRASVFLVWVLAALVGVWLSPAVARDGAIATATDVTGLLYVRLEGRDFLISSATKLPRNSRVRAGPRARATIVWENGCRERLEAGQAVIIGDPPACEAALVGETLVRKGIIVWNYAAFLAVLATDRPRRPVSP